MKKMISISLFMLIFSHFKPIYAQFPLEVGNRWDYVDGWWDGSGNGDIDTIVYRVVSDTLLPNGNVYYKVTPENYSFFRGLIRSDSSGIYYYDSVCDSEWLFYDYTLPVGEYIKVPVFNCDTADGASIYKTFDGITSLFGNDVHAMKFHYAGGIDIWYSVEVAPEFGFTKWNTASPSTNYYKYLLGCQLSGVVYGILTSINEENKLPDKYSLQQNYPNPFNPSTKIIWHTPAASWQTLTIYDVLGNEVETLVNEYKATGTYEIIFDAKNLTSGIYFYRLKAGSFIETKKLAVIK